MAKRSLEEAPLLESSDEDEADDEPPVKKKRKSIVWLWVKDFNDKEEAENSVLLEKCWSKTFKNNTKNGRKMFYRCNRGKKRVAECEAQLYLLYESTSDNVKLYKSESGHTCDETKERSNGIPNVVKAKIIKYLGYKMKPKAILLRLSKKFASVPSKVQLSNFIASLRKKSVKGKVFQLGDLEAILEAMMDKPESDTEAFVVDYELSDEIEEDGHAVFRFFISSKILIRMTLERGNHLHADTTYKLIWEGFPVLIVGTTDKDRHFHMSGICVASNEKTEDYKFLFQTLQKGVLDVTNQELKADTLIADGAGSIQNGFKHVFGDDALVLMCWVHMIDKVEDHVASLIPSADQEEILNDVKRMQLISCPATFDVVMPLFLEKWKKYEAFIAYFQKEWIDRNSQWYEGANLSTPSHNNALEAVNRVIKDEGTFRERLPLPRFIEVVKKLIQDWGDRYKNNLFSYIEIPTIELDLWTRSYQWAKLDKALNVYIENEEATFRIPAGDALVVDEQRKHLTDWRSYSDFHQNYFSEWEVMMPISKDWKLGTCSCPYHAKFYICKHIVGIALRYKLTKAPLAAKQIPIGQKRKRGRPTKAKSALTKQ